MAPYYNDLESQEPDSILKLIKAQPLVAYNGETVSQLAKQKIKDITSNYGHVTNQEDFLVYETMDDGRPDFDHLLRKDEKLQAGHNYVVLVSYDVKSIPSSAGDEVRYTLDEGKNQDLNTYFAGGGDTYGGSSANDVGLLLPLTVSSTNYDSTSIKKNASSAKKPANSRKIYITAAQNHRVRTYTSTGKFSHHYVYGHHIYKVASKRHIVHRGTCYKLSGKNQWIPAKYLLLR